MRHELCASLYCCGLLIPGCATPAWPHFQDDVRETDQRVWGRMLDRIGEEAPRPGEKLIRFFWMRFDDAYVVAVGMDEDVGYLRMRHLDRAKGAWDRPQILFLDEAVVQEVMFDRALQHRDWEDPGLVADGGGWIFEGSGWSAYRCSPAASDPWRAFGLRMLALAGVEIAAADIY